MSEPEGSFRKQLAEAGKELGHDLLTKALVAVVLIGCIAAGGLIGSQANNDTAPLAGGAIGLAVGVPAAVLIGRRRIRRDEQQPYVD